MPTIYASPDIRNYQVAKGIISVKVPPVTGPVQLLGNVSKATFEMNTTTLEHNSSSAPGILVRDAIAVKQVKAKLVLQLDEITASNLLIAVAGTLTGAALSA